MMRRVAAPLAVLALVAAQPARGATVDTGGGCDRYDLCDYVVNVRAAPGEANHLTVTSTDSATTFADPGVVMTAGRRCAALDEHTVTCLPDAGAVRIFAGDRDDTVDASGYHETPVAVDGGPGDDVLIGSPSNDRLAGGPGADRISGGKGDDWISFADATGRVVVDLRRQTARLATYTEHFDGIENVRGGRGDDLLIGNAGANLLSGGPGDDRLLGGRGDDQLLGGAGTDTLRGGPGDDTLGSLDRMPPADPHPDDIGCGSGSDSVEPADAPYVIRADCEQLWANDFGSPFVLERDASEVLIPRNLVGGPVRLTAAVTFHREIQRAIRRASNVTRPPRTSWRLPLASPSITAARAHGGALVTVNIHARAANPAFHGHARLRLRLGR